VPDLSNFFGLGAAQCRFSALFFRLGITTMVQTKIRQR
jgi:hypothetical protein